jgi:hypothetical protein
LQSSLRSPTAKERETFLNSLQPSSDKQKTAKVEALAAASAIGQDRLQMALALVDPVNYSLPRHRGHVGGLSVLWLRVAG